jgi:hypothetical protein
MLDPNTLDSIPDVLVALYAQVEQDILSDMARRLMRYDYWIPASEHQRQKLREMGATQQEIIKQLSKLTGKSRDKIKQLMQQACDDALETDREYYRQHNKDVPAALSQEMKAILNAGYTSASKLFKNLTKTTASAGQTQFVDALDRAWLQVNSGAFDYTTAIRSAIKDLSRQGLHAVNYPFSGRSDTLEVAVRRAIVTGINQTAAQMQLQLAKETGNDLVETTAHAGARPSHVVWQGKVFSLSGKNPKYPDFYASTGYGTGAGLCGWNCRHSFFPYFEGAGHAYTSDRLRSYEDKNISYNGKQYTEYEAGQMQRYNERQIRRWKREYVALEAAGLDTAQAAVKLHSWQERQWDFLNQTELKIQGVRQEIVGFGRKQASGASVIVKKINSVKSGIHKGDYPLNINPDKQGRHMLGENYIEGRSAITISIDDLQSLVHQFAGTGNIVLDRKGEWKKQEIVDLGYEIGYTVNKEGRKVKTSKVKIHYSKTGVHVVPFSGRG